MNPTIIGIAIIISAITLVGMAVIAVNYSTAPAHAKACFVVLESHGTPCYPNEHKCEIASGGVKCHK